ncbi:MAG: YraN family protein [Pseudomonadota bacterium]
MTVPSPSKNKKQTAERRGRRAESLAGWLLRLKGYRILAQRFAAPVGEIDIVAQRRGELVFVEVKYRQTCEEGRLAVTPKSQRRIQAAAQAWLARYGRNLLVPMRFDIIAVSPKGISHHRDAFR